MFWIYVLYNKEHHKIYIGQTKDLVERIRLHDEKIFNTSYTSRFSGKWELVYKEEAVDRAAALKREKQLKSYQGREYIKRIIFPL